jgi:hypothetical protein
MAVGGIPSTPHPYHRKVAYEVIEQWLTTLLPNRCGVQRVEAWGWALPQRVLGRYPIAQQGSRNLVKSGGLEGSTRFVFKARMRHVADQ